MKGYYIPKYNWSISLFDTGYGLCCRQEDHIETSNKILIDIIESYANDIKEYVKQ